LHHGSRLVGVKVTTSRGAVMTEQRHQPRKRPRSEARLHVCCAATGVAARQRRVAAAIRRAAGATARKPAIVRGGRAAKRNVVRGVGVWKGGETRSETGVWRVNKTGEEKRLWTEGRAGGVGVR